MNRLYQTRKIKVGMVYQDNFKRDVAIVAKHPWLANMFIGVPYQNHPVVYNSLGFCKTLRESELGFDLVSQRTADGFVLLRTHIPPAKNEKRNKFKK